MPIERDPDITTKLQEMLDGNAALCQRNRPEACLAVRFLTTLRGDLYFASQRCAQPEPKDCDLYTNHRDNVLASYETFKALAMDRDRILGQPTDEQQRLEAQREEQRRRDEDFKRRIDAMEGANSGFLQMIAQ